MQDFSDHTYDKIARCISSWSRGTTRDIYALSFFIYDEEDDPRRPTLTLGYNTNEQWQASVPNASDESEAKWNYAFWLQNCESLIGSEDDEALRLQWIESLGIYYTDQEEDDDFDRTLELGEEITKAFVAMAVATAKRLHDNGVIVAAFGRPIPIIVHELEYYDEIAQQTLAANPPAVAQEFAAWVDSLGASH